MDFLSENLPLVLIGALVLLVALLLLLRPRQRIRLSDSGPARPHMAASAQAGEARGIAGSAAAATSDVAGEIIGAQVHDQLGARAAEHDDFERMKGVGPKLAQLLHARGFTRYEQLAKLTDDEVERLDAEMGPFRGRVRRDRIVEQASYLARGDEDGFQARFGKL